MDVIVSLHADPIVREMNQSIHLLDMDKYRMQQIYALYFKLVKAGTALDRLSIILKYDLKRDFFQARAESILLYGCTTKTPTKRIEK